MPPKKITKVGSLQKDINTATEIGTLKTEVVKD